MSMAMTQAQRVHSRTFMLRLPKCLPHIGFDIQTKRLTELEAKGDKVEKIEIKGS